MSITPCFLYLLYVSVLENDRCIPALPSCPVTTGYQQSELANVADVGLGVWIIFSSL